MRNHEGGWRTLETRVVYSNPWMVVREDQVQRPNGSRGVYGIMTGRRTSVGVLTVAADGATHLVGQYRYAIGAHSWEIIEGCSEPGEAPIETARRELREEAGLEAGELVPLGGAIQLSNGITDQIAWLFIARRLAPAVRPPSDEAEILELRVVPFAQALVDVEEGRITDAMSVIAILRAARLGGPA